MLFGKSFGVYGPTEREVAEWGFVEAFVGFWLVVMAFLAKGRKYINILLTVLLSINLLM